jgi:hypothetical protein
MRTLKRSPEFRGDSLPPDFPMHWNVDWDNFRAEHPQVISDAPAWQARLTAALAPTLAPAVGGPTDSRAGSSGP